MRIISPILDHAQALELVRQEYAAAKDAGDMALMAKWAGVEQHVLAAQFREKING